MSTQDPDRLADGRLRIAKIVGVHGVKGAVRLKLFLEDAGELHAFGPITDAEGTEWAIALGHAQKGHWVASLEGIEDRETAAALKGTDFYVQADARPDLDDGEFYATDLVGLTARDAKGKTLGKVVAFEDFGAGPLIEIAFNGVKQPVMLPFTEAVVPEIDKAAGHLTVEVPPGYLDDEGAA
ncbi:MAG: 16S rRNA processing protein RimM [Alphaproteobacteria bacterium]|nr:16S rRNA processing protein RimM [Alphaproteobacteria bacterium SS10]